MAKDRLGIEWDLAEVVRAWSDESDVQPCEGCGVMPRQGCFDSDDLNLCQGCFDACLPEPLRLVEG